MEMMNIIYDTGSDEDGVVIGAQFPAPDRILRAGDALVVRDGYGFFTPAGEEYEPGDMLIVVERTDEAPYKRRASTGNLKVLGKDGKITVWSNVEWIMSQGHLELL